MTITALNSRLLIPKINLIQCMKNTLTVI